MNEEDFELSDIKVLDSKVRREILKLLSYRRATVSELSRLLGMSKSTVLYHLMKLTESGFVTRIENYGRKHVYYELSEKGKEVVKHRKINVALLLTSSLFSITAGILQIKRYMELKIGIKGVHPETYLLYSGLIFIAVSIILLIIAFSVWRQRYEL